MSLGSSLKGLTERHKKMTKEMIYASEIEVDIITKAESTPISSGASMFSNLDDVEVEDTWGPFKVIWVDADFARTRENAVGAALVNKFQTATVIARFWLEDVLVDVTDPYGKTYLDSCKHIVFKEHTYRFLGYDRFGMGLVEPYSLAVALEGSYTHGS